MKTILSSAYFHKCIENKANGINLYFIDEEEKN